jgi:hypothetical protein
VAASHTQLVWRRRIEAGLHVAGPFLDILLAAGDRVSRIVDRAELDAPPPARRIETMSRAERVALPRRPHAS